MLEGLALPNVDGYISMSYSNLPEIIMALGIFIFLIFFIVLLNTLINGTKSHRYRELLVDLYVVGKIKQFAKDDGLDLIAELREFKRSLKRDKLESKGLGSVVEGELKEKIAKVTEEDLEKKK